MVCHELMLLLFLEEEELAMLCLGELIVTLLLELKGPMFWLES